MKKLFSSLDTKLYANGGISEDNGDIMIENYIGFIGIPCGICPNLRINGKIIQVPMSIEEPSVIAAGYLNSSKFMQTNTRKR